MPMRALADVTAGERLRYKGPLPLFSVGAAFHASEPVFIIKR
jgi:hypothetical protein